MNTVNHNGISYTLQPEKSYYIQKAVGHTKEPDTFKIGDTVKFTRKCVGYPTKELTGTIIEFGWSGRIRAGFPVARIKAACEYGSALPFNHTISLIELTLLL